MAGDARLVRVYSLCEHRRHGELKKMAGQVRNPDEGNGVHIGAQR